MTGTKTGPTGPARRKGWRGLAPSLGALPVLLAVLVGLLGGLGTFTFSYGKGASYFSNNPESCINCHIMQDHWDAWQKSSHRHVAVCNDCHLPHHPIKKWVTKADNGFFHSLAFTLDNFHEPIQIKRRNSVVAQGACMYCHGDFVHQITVIDEDGDSLSCVRCHSDVGHALRP